jgi:chaperonin cofactor prefoldin
MDNLQERANELVQERTQIVARFNEIEGALKELQRLANPVEETTTETEEETNG